MKARSREYIRDTKSIYNRMYGRYPHKKFSVERFFPIPLLILGDRFGNTRYVVGALDRLEFLFGHYFGYPNGVNACDSM